MKPETAVVARTRDGIEAQIWVDMLRDEGIEATTFEQGPRGALGGATLIGATHQIVVNRENLADARSIIADAGGAHALAPVGTEEGAHDRMIKALLIAGGGAIFFLLLFVIVQAAAD